MDEKRKRPKQSREQVEARIVLAAAANAAKVEARVAKVYAYLGDEGPASVATLAAALHMSEASVKDSLRRLRGTHATDKRERLVRVVKWEPNAGREVAFPAPMYGHGTIRDAKRPKQKDADAARAYRRRNLGLVRARNRARLGIASMWDQLLFAGQ